MAKASYERATTFHVELNEAELRHVLELLGAEDFDGPFQALYDELQAAYKASR